MSELYKTKLLKSIDQLSPHLQTDYNAALQRHKFNLEIYVPQNNLNKKTNTKGNYLRNRLVDFEDNYQEEKENLEEMRKETKVFSLQYKELMKEGDNAKGINRFVEAYGQSIEAYKAKGYDETKLFPKRNIFEASMLLEDIKQFAMILENGDPKMIKKEKDFIKRFHTDTLKLKKGRITKEVGKKKTQPSQVEALPPIRRSLMSLRNDNLKLKNDILQTQKTFQDLTSREYSRQFDSIRVDKTIDDSDNHNMLRNNQYPNDSNQNQSQSHAQEELFISSKGMRIVVKPIKENEAKESIKASETKKSNHKSIIKKENEAKESIKASEAKTNIRRSIIKIKKGGKNQQQTELFQLYDTIQKSNYKREISNIKSYLNKYKKKKVEPLK